MIFVSAPIHGSLFMLSLQLAGSLETWEGGATIWTFALAVSHNGEGSPRNADLKKVAAQSTATRMTWPSGRRLKIAAVRDW